MRPVIFVAKETAEGENRVAASAEIVKKYQDLGFSVLVEQGAGVASSIYDEAYQAYGAEIVSSSHANRADIILKVRRPTLAEAATYKNGAAIFALFQPYEDQHNFIALAEMGFRCFAMELMPRISRAQTMDVLSSQANLAGYRAMIEAAALYDRAIPMMITAAGTVPAAKVFVMGVGVAGLQAIATARRLGAIVTATDVRAATKEQVRSLGAQFIAVEDDEFRQAETATGYAKEMSQAYQEKQAALIAAHSAKQDIVITTAIIPGRPAPRLMSLEMVKKMRPGSVIIDLAAASGGNVEGMVVNTIREISGVKIAAYENILNKIAATASNLYARNLYAFLATIADLSQTTETGEIAIQSQDELVRATLLTEKGQRVHPLFKPVQDQVGNIASEGETHD